MIDPIFQVNQPDSYNSPLNFGAPGVRPESVGWNVNSSYLTPTFMSGYRPNYSGPQNMQQPYMGFWRGLNAATPTPWQPDTPYYMDPAQYRTNAVQSTANAAMDMAMTGAQFASGIAISAGVGSALSNSHFFTRTAGMGQMMSGANSMGRGGALLGKGAGHVMSLATRAAASGVGFIPLVGPAAAGAMRGAAGMMAGMGGMVGGFAGGVLAPFAVGLAAAEGFNQLAFRPFMAGRQGGDVVSSHFRGMSMGLGTSSDPLSVSSFNANRIGFGLSTEFSKRLDFKPETGAQMLQFGLQEGLYKNIGGNVNSSTITRRTKEIAEQVKMVMEAFNEPSMQEAVKMLGQLSHQGGITSTAGVSRMANQYRMAGMMTGMSTRELMGTVGMQGQMMYGQSGLVPVLGQMAALNSITGISAAHKAGLINTATLAMMGGTEGAAQLAMQANLGLAQSPYNRMVAYNQYVMNKGPAGSVVGNLSAFGNSITNGNPLRNVGGFMMNADKGVAAQLANDPTAPMRMAIERAGMSPGSKNKSGQVYSEVLFMQMVNDGMSPQQAEAKLREMQGYSSKDFLSKYTRGARGLAQSELQGAMEKESLEYAHTAPGYAIWKTRNLAGKFSSTLNRWDRQDMETFGSMVDVARDYLFDEFSGAAGMSGGREVNLNMSAEDFRTKKRTIRTVQDRKISWGKPLDLGGGFLTKAVSLGYNFANDVGSQKWKTIIGRAEDEANLDPEKRKLLAAAKTGRMSPAQRGALKDAFGLTDTEEVSQFIQRYSTATISETGVNANATATGLEDLRFNLNKQYDLGVNELDNQTDRGKKNMSAALRGLSNSEAANLNRLAMDAADAGVNLGQDNWEQVSAFIAKNPGASKLIDKLGGIKTESTARSIADYLRVAANSNVGVSGGAFAAAGSFKTPLTPEELSKAVLDEASRRKNSGGYDARSGVGVLRGDIGSESIKSRERAANWDRVKMQYDASGQVDFSGMMNVFLDTSREAADKQLEAANTFSASVRAFTYSRAGSAEKGEKLYQEARQAAAGETSGM